MSHACQARRRPHPRRDYIIVHSTVRTAADFTPTSLANYQFRVSQVHTEYTVFITELHCCIYILVNNLVVGFIRNTATVKEYITRLKAHSQIFPIDSRLNT